MYLTLRTPLSSRQVRHVHLFHSPPPRKRHKRPQRPCLPPAPRALMLAAAANTTVRTTPPLRLPHTSAALSHGEQVVVSLRTLMDASACQARTAPAHMHAHVN